MATQKSNHHLAQLHLGNIDVANDVFKAVAMGAGFTFDPATHATLADVTASELATGNGYAGEITLTGYNDALIEDDANNRSRVSWDDIIITASGGSIGPFSGVIIYDDTTADDTVCGYIYRTSGEITVADGQSAVIPVALQIA